MNDLVLGLCLGSGGGACLVAAIVVWLDLKRDERADRKYMQQREGK